MVMIQLRGQRGQPHHLVRPEPFLGDGDPVHELPLNDDFAQLRDTGEDERRGEYRLPDFWLSLNDLEGSELDAVL